MRKVILIFLLIGLHLINKGYAQDNIPEQGSRTLVQNVNERSEDSDLNKIHRRVNEKAKYNGDLRAFVSEQLTKSKVNKDGASGIMVIDFVVHLDGSLSDFRVIKSLAKDIDEEVINIIKQTSGSWSPGILNGNSVKSYISVPITVAKDE